MRVMQSFRLQHASRVLCFKGREVEIRDRSHIRKRTCCQPKLIRRAGEGSAKYAAPSYQVSHGELKSNTQYIFHKC